MRGDPAALDLGSRDRSARARFGSSPVCEWDRIPAELERGRRPHRARWCTVRGSQSGSTRAREACGTVARRVNVLVKSGTLQFGRHTTAATGPRAQGRPAALIRQRISEHVGCRLSRPLLAPKQLLKRSLHRSKFMISAMWRREFPGHGRSTYGARRVQPA
jgi:hypothetical protein